MFISKHSLQKKTGRALLAVTIHLFRHDHGVKQASKLSQLREWFTVLGAWV